MNSVVNGNEDYIDVQVFDIEKCFDALWTQDCINDVFDAGFNNDKLPLSFLESKNAQCAVKVGDGLSDRVNIKNIIMQGTVWASLLCTTSMDKLGQIVYNNKDLLYKNKGKVETQCLGMVDDVLSIQKCSSKAVEMNAVINAFVEMKKLNLNQKQMS